LASIEERLEGIERRLENIERSFEEVNAALDSLARALARLLESDSASWAMKTLASCSDSLYKALTGSREAGLPDLVRALGDPEFRRGLGALIASLRAVGSCTGSPGE